MEKSNIPPGLYEMVKIAVKDIYRYERMERYALVVVLTAAKNNRKVNDIFIQQARAALINHPVRKKLEAVS